MIWEIFWEIWERIKGDFVSIIGLFLPSLQHIRLSLSEGYNWTLEKLLKQVATF